MTRNEKEVLLLGSYVFLQGGLIIYEGSLVLEMSFAGEDHS